MGIIAKYKFNQNTSESFIPTFNADFTDYTYTDEIDTDGYTIRTISNDSGVLPTRIYFATSSRDSLLSVLECNTSNVTDMSYMFNACTNLTTLDTSSWDTSKVTNMGSMFNSCSKLQNLDVSKWKTSKVTNMSSVFYNCSSLQTVDVSNWDTSSVINMSYMFNSCSSLQTLDVSKWNTSKVTDINGVFYGCSKLTTLDVSNWNVSKVTNMSTMFAYCTSLTTLNLGKWVTSSVTNMNSTFNNCSSLQTLDISNFNTSKVTSTDSTFKNCSSLQTLKWTNWLKSVDLSSTALTRESLTGLIYRLGNATEQTLTLNDTLSTYLKDVEFMYADIKGWTITPSTTTTFSYIDIKASDNISNVNNSTYNTCIVEITESNKYYRLDDVVEAYKSCDTMFLYSGDSLTSLNSFIYTNNTVARTKIKNLCFMDNFNTSNVTNMGNMFNGCSNLQTLVVSNFDTSKVTAMNNMFVGCPKLTILDVGGFDTSSATAMNGMFYGCSNLQTLDVSNFKTSKVTNMSYMFCGCSNLQTLDVSNFDTSIVTSMSYMFEGCTKLTTLDVSNFNTKSVANMSYMFNNCSNLQTLNVSNFDTLTVGNIGAMFSNCSNLTTLDVSNWKTSNVTNMGSTFNSCPKLQNLDVSNWDTSKVTGMSNMFLGCSSLQNLNVSNFKTSLVTNISSMFNGCSSLTTLDVSKWDTSIVTNMNYLFNNCSKLQALDISKWDTSKVINMNGVFYGCSKLTTLDVSGWKTSLVTGMNNIFSNCSNLQALDVSKWDTSKVANMGYVFNGCSNLRTLNVGDWDTSKVNEMGSVFRSCSRLTTLDLSKWKTSNVTNMSFMFDSCSGLQTLDISNFDTSKVTSMINIFASCSNLTTLDISKWDTSKVDNMNNMFSKCTKLQALDINNWDTSSVTNMRYIFNGCSRLTTLDVSDWNTKNVTNMSCMFHGCSNLQALNVSKWDTSKADNTEQAFRYCAKLTTLDLSGWKTSSVTNMSFMFEGCSRLTTLDISNFDISKVTSMNNMFASCPVLKTIGMLYSNAESINKLVQLYRPNGLVVYYYDANPSQLTPINGVTFEKYVMPTTIQLPPHIQLHSLPNGTKDEVDVKTGILTRRIGEVVLDGSENWLLREFNTTNTECVIFSTDIDDKISSYDYNCDKFKNTSTDVMKANNIEGIYSGGSLKNLFINISKTKASTVEEFKNWLSNNNVKVQYLLATITEQLILNHNNSCDYGRVLPTGMCDKYDVVNSMYTQTMTSILLDGANAWDAMEEFENTIKFTATGTTVGVENLGMLGAGGLYCDNNLFPNINDDSDVEHCRVDAQGNKFYIYISKDRLMSPDLIGYQIWLQTNKFNMTYELVEHLTYSKPYEELDPTQARWEGMDCVKNGAIRYHTNNSDNFTLYPTLEYIAPSSNSFKTNMLKPNTQYSVYAQNSVEGQILNLGGNPVEFANGAAFTSGTDNRITFDNAEFLDKAVIVEGDVTNESVPYFTGMQSVETPILTMVGKNLASVEKNIVKGGGNSLNILLKDFILKPNTTYSISSEYTQVHSTQTSVLNAILLAAPLPQNMTSNNVIINHCNSSGGQRFSWFENRTFTTGSTNIYLTLLANDGPGNIIRNIQIEESSVATSYEPYQLNSLTINEPIELRGIGDIKDELNLETGEFTQRVGAYTFTGNEPFNIGGPAGSPQYFHLNINAHMTPQIDDSRYPSGNVPLTCNRLPYIKYDEFTMDGGGINYTYTIRLNFADCNCNKGATVADLQNYLRNNETTIYYPITPITRTVDPTWNLCQYEKFYQAVKSLPLNTLQVHTSSDTIPPVVNLECSTGSISDIEGEIENSETISFTNAVLTPSVNPINNVIESYGATPTISTNGLAESTIGDGLDSSVFVQDGEMPNAKMLGETLYNIFTSKKYFWAYALNNNNASFDENGICSTTQGSRRYEIIYASPSCSGETYTYRIWYDFSDFDFDVDGIDEATFYVGLTGKKADGSGDDRYIQAISNTAYAGNSITIYRNGSKKGWWQYPKTIKTSNETKEFVVGFNHTSYGTTFNLKTGGTFKFGVMFIKGDVLTQPFGDFYDGGLHSIEEPTITTYNSNKTESTTTHLSDIVLRKIDTFQDELDLKTGILTRRVGEITLNGSENWKRYSTTAPICTLDTTEYTRTSLDIVNVVSNNCDITANTYRSTITYGGNTLVPKISMQGGVIGLNLKGLVQASASSGQFTEADTKAWLQANPITIQYILQEEKTEQVDLSKITKPYAYTDGTIQLSSNGTIPTLEYQTLAANNMTANVKPNTTYTVFGEGANGQVLSICGTNITLSSLPTVITSGSVANNTVTYSGNQAIKGLILHEGNYYDTTVKNPSLTIATRNPYKSITLKCNEDITLRAIGEFKDEVDLLTSNLSQRIGEIILDGNQNYVIDNAYNGDTATYIQVALTTSTYSTSAKHENVTCDTLQVIPFEDLKNTSGEWVTFQYPAHGKIYIQLLKSNLSSATVNGIKEYFSNNITKIHYALQTSVAKKVEIVWGCDNDQHARTVQMFQDFESVIHVNTHSNGIQPHLELDYYDGVISGTSGTIGVEVDDIKSAVLKGQTLVNLVATYKHSISTVANPLAWSQKRLFLTNIKPNTRYTLRAKMTEVVKGNYGPRVQIFFATNATGEVNTTTSTSDTLIFTSPAELSSEPHLRLIVTGSEAEATEVDFEILLLEGEHPNIKDIPFFEGMLSVQMPVLTTTGKNLFDINNSVDGYLGEEGNVNPPDMNNKLSNFIPVKPNTTYTYSFDNIPLDNVGDMYWTALMYFIDINVKSTINSNRILYQGNNDTFKTFTFTTPSDCNYIRIGSRGLGLNNATVQLEEGSTVTTYEPHKSNILTCNEEVVLCGTGEVKDELNLLTGELTQAVGEVVLNGSESSWLESGLPNQNITKIFIVNSGNNPHISHPLSGSLPICEQLPSNNESSDDFESIIKCQGTNGHGFYIRINRSRLETEDIEGFKKWLSKNPLTIKYALETPITKTIDINITNQVNESLQFKAPVCTNIEHLQLSSDNNILPTMHYAIPSKNSFYLPSIKTGTLYTLKYPLGSGTIRIGDISYNITSDSMLFTTPLNITGDKNIVIFPSDDNPQNVILLEGSFRDREIEYFTGMKSVVNPIITIRHSLTGSEQSYKLPNNITLRSLPNGVADTIDIVNGRLTQSVGYREYQDGDNELQGIYTDGYHTVYGLPTPTISNIVFPKPTINEYSIMKLSSDELIPQLTFRALSSNHFPLDLLESNATYTLKAKVSKIGSFTLGGTYTNNLFGTTVIPLKDATNNSLIFDGDLGVSEVVLVKGDVSNLTVPYFSDILSVNNGIISISGENGELNTLSLDDNGIVLRSCGIYTDTIDLTTGTLTIKVGETTFKGIENWYKFPNDTVGYSTFRLTLQGVRDTKGAGTLICNKFKHLYNGKTEECVYTDTNSISINVKESTIGGDTVETFKLWLTRNNVTLVYPLSDQDRMEIPLANVWTTMPPTSYEVSTTITTVTQDISLKPLLNATVAITTLEQIAANLEAQNIDLQAQNESLEQENVATMLALTDLYETMVAPMAVMSLNSDPYAMSTMSLDDEELATNVVGYTVSPMSMIYAKLVHRGLKTINEVPYNLQVEVMYALKGME